MFDDELEEDWLTPDFKKQLADFEQMYNLNNYLYIDSDKVENLLEHFIINNQLKKAKWAAEKALEHFPTNSAITIKYAQLLSMSGKINEALNILLELEKIEVLNIDLLLSIGNFYSQIKDSKTAIDYYKKAFELAEGEERADIAIDIAIELENIGDYFSAIKMLKSVMKDNVLNDLVVYELAHCYERVNDFENAIQAFKNYIDEEPYSYTTWYNLGNVYAKIDNYDSAIWAYEYAILINDTFIPALYNLANAYLEANKVENALEYYKKCLELDQDDPMVYCSMGECYEELGEFEEAYEMYTKSTELLPHLADAWLGRGVISEILGFYPRAITELKTAIKIAPHKGEYWRALGNIYEEESQNTLAKEAYETAFALEPDDESIIVDYLSFIGEDSIEEVYEIIRNNIYLEKSNAVNIVMCYLLWKEGDELNSLLIFEEIIEEDIKLAKRLFFYFPEMQSEPYYSERLQEFDKNTDHEKF